VGTYTPPVSELVNLGRPMVSLDTPFYAPYRFGPEHIPELIRLLRDEELAWAESSSPVVFARVHAWRALGHLRAVAAVEPLLDLLAEQDDEDDDWDDWTTEEVPAVLGMIGPVAIPATAARLEHRNPQGWAPVYYAQGLTEIAGRHPAARAEVIGHLSRVLETAADNDPGLNGSVIADLLGLKAAEAWPAIERAFASGNVDESVAGGAAEVKWELGLGPRPPSRVRLDSLRGMALAPTAKERAEARARQRKAEKRKNKKKRKGR